MSFRELIDWLGQMKSPVVTQEDINKSGLVMFKAKDFPTKQKNEEVSDNCVDKVSRLYQHMLSLVFIILD